MDKHPRQAELLSKVKLLNPNDNENTNYDGIIEFVLDKVVSDVSNYTHLAILELPEGLDNTIIGLCSQLIATHDYLGTGNLTNVDTLNEGDTSVKFKSPATIYAELQSVNSLTDDYLVQLNQFRVVKWS